MTTEHELAQNFRMLPKMPKFVNKQERVNYLLNKIDETAFSKRTPTDRLSFITVLVDEFLKTIHDVS